MSSLPKARRSPSGPRPDDWYNGPVMQRTLLRRFVTVPAVVAIFVLAWLGSPVLVVTALAVDAFRWLRSRTPFMAVRLVLFLMSYSLAEVAGLISLGVVWVTTGGGRWADITPATFAVQRGWAVWNLGATRRIFGLDIGATGLDAVEPAPFLLLARHASIVDNLLPAIYISRPHGTHVRYVMKRELLLDPALDVAGNRLVNLFIARMGADAGRETDTIARLAATLPDDEAILIYPEGTRFSKSKLERMLRILKRRSPDLHAMATSWRHVLPPRPGGTLALLDACTADVVVMVHRGLGGFARVADIWKGAMVRRKVDVEFWRIPRSEIPEGDEARTRWLFELWGRIDRWVGEPA